MEEKISVVYKLGSGSKHEDKELRYSLRSLSNFKNLGNVFIIGHKPSWVNYENVIHIQALDPYKSNKDSNLINKLILACLHKDISQRFLNMSDDQLFLYPTGLEWFENPLKDNSHIVNINTPNKKLNRWQNRLKNTIEVLKKRVHLQNCYEAHCPYLLDKYLFPKTMFKYDYGFGHGYCGNTLYYNTNNIVGKEKRESDLIRVVKEYRNVLELEKDAKNKRFMNYTERATNQILFLFLQKRFPQKSKYEL